MSTGARWICPDCPAALADAPAALEHEQRLGHGVPSYVRPRPRPQIPVQVTGQLELPIHG